MRFEDLFQLVCMLILALCIVLLKWETEEKLYRASVCAHRMLPMTDEPNVREAWDHCMEEK